ncbi:hypothetical protein [Agrobacterium vitis]|uniref:hypothetical protein n=1 Tax=Agrobacterium vitis TaxID=373 RepID=UPI00307DCA8A
MVAVGRRNNRGQLAFGAEKRSTEQDEVTTMSEAKQTTNHQTIKSWIEDRGGRPSKVGGSDEGGILRIDFGEAEENFVEIEWDEFFDIFESSGLAFLYQDETKDGKKSRFNKFVSRDS